jgi:hypothetical protein
MGSNRVREILDHNNDIIQDNVLFGYKSRTPEVEINQYYRDVKREQRLLKKHLQSGGEVEWNKSTHMWVAKS